MSLLLGSPRSNQAQVRWSKAAPSEPLNMLPPLRHRSRLTTNPVATIRDRPGEKVAVRASKLVLFVVTTLVLLPTISGAQNNAMHETEARAGISSAALAPGVTQPLKSYHDRSIWDIRAIGNRDIGCTGGLDSRYSLQAQIEMGRSYARKVETSSRLITDPVITEYVNRIGKALVRNSDEQIPLNVKIIDSHDVNAFALPGGFVFVNSGLILAADNEAELAGVISHEIAHVVACHATQEMAREEPTDVASMSLIFRIVFRRAICNTMYLKPIPRFESEADFLGVEYLYKAGYDPEAQSSFLERVRIMEKQNRRRRASAFEFYPHIADRIERTRQEIKTLLPPEPEYKLDTSDFQQVKARLAELKK